MKIKVTESSYSEVIAKKPAKHIRPKRPMWIFKALLKLVSFPDLLKTGFRLEKIGMERLAKKEPALFLMNHSSFIDLEIVTSILYPRSYNIVATSDSFIGMDLLMRLIGCIPTHKFVTDSALVRDILHAVRKLNDSIVLFPEASYSFDGTATPLPDTTGKLIKMLGIPVVMIRTYGAFSRDPLYNNLQVRKVNVSATQKYLLSKEDIEKLSAEEINDIVNREFDFDNFAWQKENHIKIAEPFRADCLNRVLYKCPQCHAEGKTVGKGTTLTCSACGAEYSLDEYGYISKKGTDAEFDHIPDWYKWERDCVREELIKDTYKLDVPVDICMTIDTKRLYRVGEGRLVHTKDGFILDGCNGELHYEQKPLASYSLYSDFNWYEVGDVICIGNNEHLYYCFPKTKGDVVAKTRLATEELYKLVRKNGDASRNCHSCEKNTEKV